MKSGTYFIYHGKEYMDSTKSVPKGYKILLSGNKDDLDDGFYCTESENFMKKFGFVCEKKVSISEITEAYKIETTAIYKTQKYYVDRASTQDEDMVRIYTPPISTVKETELYNEYKKNGFSDGMKFEYGDVLLYKYVSINDPDLQLIEKRTELDISKL